MDIIFGPKEAANLILPVTIVTVLLIAILRQISKLKLAILIGLIGFTADIILQFIAGYHWYLVLAYIAIIFLVYGGWRWLRRKMSVQSSHQAHESGKNL